MVAVLGQDRPLWFPAGRLRPEPVVPIVTSFRGHTPLHET
jgi:hypothetical protein